MNESPPAEEPVPLRRRWAAGLALALLPAAVAFAAYFKRPLSSGVDSLSVAGDAAFYVYQITRAAELNGRWWRLAQDEPIGRPYPSGVAKLPQLYEGPDLLLASTATARWCSPRGNYLLLMGLVLVVNGWVAGVLTWRITRSALFAAIAILLITLNWSTAARLNGHFQLFKHAWTLLAVWAFSAYLDRPSLRTGAALGATMALVLQGSYYPGYLLGVALAVWWVGALVRGTIGSAHARPTLAAVAVFIVLAGVTVFPVFMVAARDPLSVTSFQRGRFDAWRYSAQLWQYVVPPWSGMAAVLARAPGMTEGSWEGWHFPGWTIWLGTVVYVVHRIRRVPLSASYDRVLGRGFGIVAILVLLSLAGGPSALLVHVVPPFRSYGRAGLLAVGLWCVLATSALGCAVRRVRVGPVRLLAAACVLALAVADGVHGRMAYLPGPRADPPWVAWLARQPPDVRAIVLPRAEGQYFDEWWTFRHLAYWLTHRHETLTGADLSLMNVDLTLLGGPYERLTEAGLRFAVSLGYETVIVDPAYVAAHPLIDGLSWLRLETVLDGWRVLRVADPSVRLRTATLPAVLAEAASKGDLEAVPAASWVTDRLAVAAPTAIVGTDRVWAVWIGPGGGAVGRPKPVLLQHYVAASVPAFTVYTPGRAGRYELRFVDAAGRLLGVRSYEVAAGLPILSGAQAAAARGDGVVLDAASDGSAFVLENHSPSYLQVHVGRGAEIIGWQRFQPAVGGQASHSLCVRVRSLDGGPERCMLPPRDLPPFGRVRVSLDEAGGAPAGGQVEVTPTFVNALPDPDAPPLVVASAVDDGGRALSVPPRPAPRR